MNRADVPEGQVGARLDSGEYATASWNGGGPQNGWFGLVMMLRELEYDATPAALDAMPLETADGGRRGAWSGPVAFVAEDWDGSRALARFDAHVEREDSEHEESPRDLTFGEAVDWARSRAPRVQFRPGGTDCYYSLGSEPVPGMPAWPAGLSIAPRPDRTPLDGSIQERPWLIRATSAPGAAPLSLPTGFPGTVVEHTVGAEGWSALIDVIAADVGGAILSLNGEIGDRALLSAGTDVDSLPYRRP